MVIFSYIVYNKITRARGYKLSENFAAPFEKICKTMPHG